MSDNVDVVEWGEEVRPSTPVLKDNSGIGEKNNSGIRSVKMAMRRLLSNASSADEEKKTADINREPSARSVVRRTNTFTLSNMSAAEVTTLMQDTIYKESFWEKLKSKVPVPIILW